MFYQLKFWNLSLYLPKSAIIQHNHCVILHIFINIKDFFGDEFRAIFEQKTSKEC